MIRAALLHMGIGFTFGALILWHKGLDGLSWAWGLLAPHVTLVVFGWTMQLVMGIAFWILPRHSQEPRYGAQVLGWWSWGFLNVGVVLFCVAILARHTELAVLGYLGVMLALGLFVRLVWSRVKPFGV